MRSVGVFAGRRGGAERDSALAVVRRTRVARAWLLFVCLLSSCTPVREYKPDNSLRVQVEADDAVRAAVGEIEVMVESRTAVANSWTLVTSQRFTPSDEAEWPLAFQIDSYDPNATYQVTATSRDEVGGVSIQARAITAVNLPSPREVQLRLDAACLQRTMLCSRMLTCSLGDCVDARAPLREPTDSSARTQTANGDSAPRADMASACGKDGARSCDSASDTLPLLCKGGSWQPEPECAGNTRCYSGRCVASGAQCATLSTGARFCDASGLIYRCQDTTTATPSPCDDNEMCVDNGDGAAFCDCRSGFVRDNQVCTEPMDCRDQGGCDPLTKCQMDNGKRVCTPCPPGYAGTGETGCKPLAVGLTVVPGVLLPEFEANTPMYSATVPFLTPRVGVTVNFDVPAHLTINEQPALPGQAWFTPVLADNQMQLAVSLRTDSSVRNEYRVTLERAKPKQTYLKASNGKMGDQFGAFTAAYGDTIVVGAPYETRSTPDPEGTSSTVLNAGAAYVFVRDANGGWRQQGYLKADPIQEQDYFGVSVAIWKDRIAIGAPGDLISSVIPGAANGKVHVFARTGDKWEHEKTINSANNVASGDSFGFRVAMHENTLMVGAPLDDNGASRSGAVYVYEWNGSDWQNPPQRLKAMPPGAEARFGSAIEIADNFAVVGSFQESDAGLTRSGAAYAYTRGAGDWPLVQRLVSPMPRDYSHFGATLAAEGNTLVVTAPHNPLETASTHAGEAYVFEFTGTDFKNTQLLTAAAPVAGDQYASSVALRNGMLLLSAPYEKSTAAPHGAAYLFAHSERGFELSATIAPPSIDDADYFGYDVSLTDTHAVIAAPSDDAGGHGVSADSSDNSVTESGAVYIFE